MAHSSEGQQHAAKAMNPTKALISDIRSLNFSGVADTESLGIKNCL